MHRDIEQRHIDVATLAGLLRAEQAAQQTGDADHSCHGIDHGGAEPLRWTIGLARQRHQAGLSLHEEIVAGPSRAFVVAAIGRNMQAYDRRIDCAQRLVVEAELCRLVAAQIVHHRICRRCQPAEGGLAFVTLEVERDALLV